MILTFSYEWQSVPRNDLSLRLNIMAGSRKISVSSEDQL